MPAAKRKRASGEGLIRKRPDGRWEGRIRLGKVAGRYRFKTYYAKTKEDCARQVRQALHDLDKGLQPVSETETVKGWLEYWTTNQLELYVRRGKLKRTTAANYETLARRHLVPELGSIKLARLKIEHVNEMIDRKVKAGYSASSVRLMRIVLQLALEDAIRAEKLQRNVARLSDPVKTDSRASSYLTRAEVEALLNDVKGDRLEALYLLLALTGLRRGEALALTWGAIDFDKRSFMVKGTLVRQRTSPGSESRTELVIGKPKTAASFRTCPLSQPLVEALKLHRARQAEERLRAGSDWHESDLVFTTEYGQVIDPANFGRHFARHTERAGIGRRHPHELRHSVATLLLAAGAQLHEVSRMLGHSSYSVTKDIYAHFTNEHATQVADKLSDVVFGPR